MFTRIVFLNDFIFLSWEGGGPTVLKSVSSVQNCKFVIAVYFCD